MDSDFRNFLLWKINCCITIIKMVAIYRKKREA